MLTGAAITISPGYEEVLALTRDGIGSPGTWLSGHERVGVAAEARASLAGDPGPGASISQELAEVAHAVAEAPADITPEWIEDLERRGLDRFSYVEAAGIVCRIAVIDTFALGVGAETPSLPEARSGEPSRVPVRGAVISRAWVPMVGPGHALSSLSAVEEERDSMQRISDVLYLEQVDATGAVEKGGLVRSQIELVAARTSYLNDCFY